MFLANFIITILIHSTAVCQLPSVTTGSLLTEQKSRVTYKQLLLTLFSKLRIENKLVKDMFNQQPKDEEHELRTKHNEYIHQAARNSHAGTNADNRCFTHKYLALG